jgi:hypothetical protein
MTIGICSLWHNAPELLPEFERLLAPGGWEQAILVDNASPEPATQAAYAAAVAELGPGARVLRLAANRVLHGWNAGIAALGTDIVVQMANDVIMTDARWLTWATDELPAGVIQGPICWLRGNVGYIDGCLLVTTRTTWERLGGLAADVYIHPGYWSDVDFCWRANLLGYAIRPTRCGIRHLANSTSGGGQAPGFWEHEQRNAKTFIVRYVNALLEHRQVVVDEP